MKTVMLYDLACGLCVRLPSEINFHICLYVIGSNKNIMIVLIHNSATVNTHNRNGLIYEFNQMIFCFQGVNNMGKETSGLTAAGKRSLLQEKQNDSPPKRPKSAEGKTSANEQVN